MGMNLRVGERGEGSASGWIEKGMMGRHRQIIMNMQQVLLYPVELVSNGFYILVTLHFTTSFVSLVSSFSSYTTVVSLFD